LEFKDTTKIVEQKIVSKFFYKKSTKNPKAIFLDLFNHVLGRVSAREVKKKNHKKSRKTKSHSGLFLASDPPTHHGVRLFFFAGPLFSPALPIDL
jgi:hypothetical protein